MKINLPLAMAGLLIIFFLSGCQEGSQSNEDDLNKTYIGQLQAEIVEKDANLAKLQAELDQAELDRAELEAGQDEVSDIQRQLQVHKVRIASLEYQLEQRQREATQREIIQMEDPTLPSSKLVTLKEEYLTYYTMDQRHSVHVTMLDTTWDGDKVTVSWELMNMSNHKIFLYHLSVKARDQMWLKGVFAGQGVHTGEAEDPVSVSPTLQNTRMLWPKQTAQFDSEWMFGPASKEITINFISVDNASAVGEETIEISSETSPPFTVVRLLN